VLFCPLSRKQQELGETFQAAINVLNNLLTENNQSIKSLLPSSFNSHTETWKGEPQPQITNGNGHH
jgi:hypothetical protein